MKMAIARMDRAARIDSRCRPDLRWSRAPRSAVDTLTSCFAPAATASELCLRLTLTSEPHGGSRDRPNADSLPLTHEPNELSDACAPTLIKGASANRTFGQPPPESVF